MSDGKGLTDIPGFSITIGLKFLVFLSLLPKVYLLPVILNKKSLIIPPVVSGLNLPVLSKLFVS